VNLRTAFVVSLVFATSLFAQVEEQQRAQVAPRLEEAATKASEPAAKLRLITEAVTQNFIPKYADGAGALTNSAIYEDAGLVGIGTITPANALHVKITDGVTNAPLKLETSGADSITGVSLKNDARNWLIRVDGTDGDKFKIFDANAAAYRFAIDDTGRVGIGTSSPLVPFHLYGAATGDMFMGIGPDPTGATGPGMTLGHGGFSFGRGAGFINVRPDALAVAPNPSLRFLTANTPRMIITNTGAVGIGTTTPDQTFKLHIVETGNIAAVAEVTNLTVGTDATSVFRTRADAAVTSYISHSSARTAPVRFGNAVGGWSEILTFGGNGLMIGTNHTAPLILGTSSVSRIHVTPTGEVGIGTSTPTAKLHVVGDIVTTGNITGAKVIGAVYQDVAEWVPATSDMTPGTVVVLNLDKSNEVMPSSHQYDTAVAGVVSAAPGIILGVGGDSKEQIATTGRVKVRVDARTVPVKVGDLLVTSDMPGTAMRSEPMDLNGRKFHQPGTIIGKALEPLAGGVGEILVLLSMQ